MNIESEQQIFGKSAQYAVFDTFLSPTSVYVNVKPALQYYEASYQATTNFFKLTINP